MAQETRDGISFGHEAAAGADGSLTFDVGRRAGGLITGVSVRIYAGAETDLKIGLFVDPEEGNRRPIVEPVGKANIDGDDDTYTWNLAHPLDQGDTIVVTFDNQDLNNPHAFRVNMDIDFGSLARLVDQFEGVVL